MLALGIELLMRRAVITRWGSREKPEWPPHPDRVFMALVAAFGENGEHELERDALVALEALGPPALKVSETASERTAFTSYVPVNDDGSPISKGKVLAPMGSLPIGRNRQPRGFPAVVPSEPKFHLIWETAEFPEKLRPALDRLCRSVTYLGHSATPVRVWIEDGSVKPNLVPTDGRAAHRLRTFGPGRLDDLRARYQAGLRPQPMLWQGYALSKPEPQPQPVVPFDPGLIVLRQVGGRKFALESCGLIADAIRDTLMSRWGRNPPEWLSGHEAEGTPSRQNRPAVLPLGFVDRQHADGHLLGVAIALPVNFPPEDAVKLFDLLAQHDDPSRDQEEQAPFLQLAVKNPPRDGPVVGKLDLELDERPGTARPYTLRPDTWTGPGCLWVTATPVVLPRFPRRGLTPEEVVARACVEAGYPEPVAVRTSFAPALAGVPHVRSFVIRPRNGRPQRPLTHAVVHFAGPVRGPVLIGAGRYAGFGICRPTGCGYDETKNVCRTDCPNPGRTAR